MTFKLNLIWHKIQAATALVAACVVIVPARPLAALSESRPTMHVWVSKQAYAPGEPVLFTVTAYNSTCRSITLRFPSTQTFDLTITPQFTADASARVGPLMPVWQWSRNRMFTQAVTAIALAPGAKQSWQARWNQTSDDAQSVSPGRYMARAWLPLGPGYESAPFMFDIAESGNNESVASPLHSSSTSAKIDIRGTVTKLRVADKNWRKDELGFILVGGRKEPDTQVDRAAITVTRSTRVWRQSATGRTRAAFSHLKEGDRVAVRFTGPVRESYPVGATAGEVTILTQEKKP